jgi:membrane associated rhomboid family serine protease
MSARRRLADLYWGADFLDERRTDYPVTCTLMFVQAAAYALLRLWQEGYVPAFIDFDGLWAGSLLRAEAIEQGRYYVFFTCYLVVYDLVPLLFACAGLWLLGSRFERRFGSLAMACVWLLNAALVGGAFLVTDRWLQGAANGAILDWRLDLLDLLRPQWRIYRDVWLVAPMWWPFAVLAVVGFGGWSFAHALLALGLGVLHGTALFGYLGMQCAYEGCVLVALAGLLPLVCVVVPMLVLALFGLPGFVLRTISVRGREREQCDLDRLLDKVRERGIDQLSPGEAERLRSLSQRLRARRGA